MPKLADPTVPPAGPALPADQPFSISTGSGDHVRTDNTSSPALSGSGDGSTAPEQYRAYDPTNLVGTAPIEAGEEMLLRSEQTGMYCQLRPTPTNTTQITLYCDQASPATATPLTYTGNGLSYNGVALVSTGPGTPLMLANTTAVPLTASSDQLAFESAGEPTGMAAVAW